MAVITPPFVQQGGSHPAATFREMLMAVTGSPTGAFTNSVQPTTGGGGHGLAGPSDLAVTQNGTPNMSVNVAAGGCFVRGTEAAAQGVYAGFNDATLNLAVAASDPTNPRRDLVVMRVRDAFYSGASTDIALFVVTGTAAAAPVDPTIPANSLVIARIAVAAAVTTVVTANLTALAPRASSLGGLVPCTSTTRPTGAALWDGLTIYETDTQETLSYYATPAQWRRPWRQPWGYIGITEVISTTTGYSVSADITGLSVTFTAVANRRYRVTLFCPELVQVTAIGLTQIFIADAAGATLNRGEHLPATATSTYTLHAQYVNVASLSAGSYTFKGRITTAAGTVSVNGGANVRNFILVEDIGPIGVPT